MRLVESVSSKWLDNLIEYVYREILIVSLLMSRSDELVPLLHEEIEFLFTDGSSEDICLAEGESGERLYQLHDLFLIDRDTVCRLQDGLERWMRILDDLATELAIDELWDIGKWSRTVE